MKADKPNRDSHMYDFGPFRLDAAERVLLRGGEPVTIPPKAFDTLVVLVGRRGHAVRKDELIAAVWPDTFVEENNLNQYISVLRKALGENGDGSRYIETVPRWGYRFVGDVTELEAEPGDVVVQTTTRTSVVVREESEVVRARGLRSLISPAVIMATLALLVAIAALAFAWGGLRSAPEPAAVHSLAVLPFRVLDDGRGENAHLELAMADAVIGRLGKLKRVSVRSTSAIRRYAETEPDPMAVGRDLGVDAVLDGRIQTSEGRIRVTAQLVNARDGSSMWTESFDERLSDVFVLQDAIAARVVRGLAPVLEGEELRPMARPTESARAYEAYLKGRYLWSKRTTEAVRASIECFKSAIDEDPDFALAYVGLADAYAIEAAPLAEPALRKALELDDSIGEAHASMGFYRMFHHWDLPMADSELRLAIERSPNYATAHQWLAISLAVRGRFAEAKAAMARAIECDPVSPNMRTDMAQICYFEGDDEAAIGYCRSALELDPGFLFAHQNLFAAYARAGRYDEAVAELMKALELGKAEPSVVEKLRAAYATSGWTGFCRARIASGLESNCSLAGLYAQTGNPDLAIEHLRRALGERDFFMLFVGVDPNLAPLRSDPRYLDIARRVGVLETVPELSVASPGRGQVERSRERGDGRDA